jgi:chaperonin GroES
MKDATLSDTEDAASEDLSDDFNVVEKDDGSAEIIPIEDELSEEGSPEDFYTENLAEKLSREERDEIVTEFIDLIAKDKQDREDHDKQGKKALESTGLTGDAPAAFSGGSVLIHPVLAQASVEFASAAGKEIFPSEGPVRTNIIGKQTRKKMDKAERKRQHMNWQLTEQMPEYIDSIEKMLPMLCLNGSQYIRMYWWETGKRPRSEYISAEKIYLPYHVSSFYTSQRMTYEEEMSDMEYDLRIENGIYQEFDDEDSVDVDSGSGTNPDDTSAIQRAERKIEGKSSEDDEGNESKIVYNIYCYRKIDKDGLSKGYAPYIISINKHTEQLLAIYRNWEYEDKARQAMDWIVEWPMIPWGRSVYTIGTGHLVGQLARGASGSLRALLDSGLANTAPTLFMTKAMGMSGQAPPVQLGAINQLRTNAGLDDIRKSIMAPPFNQPSNVLFELMGFLVQAASGMVQSTIHDQADATNNVPVGTQLSRIEQGMKVFSAVHKRLHRAQKRTLSVLHRLNRMYMEDNGKPEDYANKDDAPLAFKSDYEGVIDVSPISDPDIFSEQQRFTQAQTVYTIAKENPDICNRIASVKRLLSAMKVSGIDEIIPDPSSPDDENPAAENMSMALGKPAQALPEQDHLAHIQTLLDFYRSKSYGQNPAIKPKFAAPALDHLIQHMVFGYGKHMQETIKNAIGKQHNVEDIIGDDGKVSDELSQAIAAASPLVIKDCEAMAEKVLPILQEMAQYIQSITPKPPVDPGTAMLQGEQIRAQTEEKKIATHAQTEQQKIQSNAQTSTQKAQLASHDHQQKLQTESALSVHKTEAAAEEKQSALQVQLSADASKAQLEREKMVNEQNINTEDNATALEIANIKGDQKSGAISTNTNPRP